MSIITNLSFSWYTHSYLVPPLDSMHEWNSAKSRNQPLFRSIIKLGTYNKPANQQSNWPILNSFWKEFSQCHAPPPPERKPFNTQVLDNAVSKYRDNTLIMLWQTSATARNAATCTLRSSTGGHKIKQRRTRKRQTRLTSKFITP